MNLDRGHPSILNKEHEPSTTHSSYLYGDECTYSLPYGYPKTLHLIKCVIWAAFASPTRPSASYTKQQKEEERERRREERQNRRREQRPTEA